MPPRARLSQDRSRQRRDALLDAAIELFAEGGAPAITHRAVARRAGVSAATTTYYFGSIDALIDEALTRHMESWLRDLRGFTTRPAPSGFSKQGAVDLIEAVFAARNPEIVMLQLSIYLAATRSPTLRPRAVAALDAIEALAVEALEGAGVDEAAQLARACVAMIGGSAMGRLSRRQSDREEAEALYWALRGLFVAALTTDAEKDGKIRDFRASHPS